MEREYNNKQVYDFLIEENLSEELDCFRICDECGKPMIEGYVVDGCNTYCSEDCLHKHITEDEFLSLFDNGNGDTYWTTWYEESLILKQKKDTILKNNMP